MWAIGSWVGTEGVQGAHSRQEAALYEGQNRACQSARPGKDARHGSACKKSVVPHQLWPVPTLRCKLTINGGAGAGGRGVIITEMLGITISRQWLL